MFKVFSAIALLIAVPAFAQDPFISADDALKLVGKDGVRFVASDAEKEFEKGHLPGAVESFAHDLQLLDDVRKCKGLPMCEAAAYEYIGKGLGIDAATQEKMMHPDTLTGRPGRPEDCANAMLWLASPAGSWVSGQIINVHGGGTTYRLMGH